MSKKREKEKLYQSLTNISDEFIEEMMEVSAHKGVAKRRKMRYLIPFAACFVLVFSAFSVLAETSLGTQVIDIFTSRKQSGEDNSESGYDLLINVKKLSVSELGEVKQVSKIILKQIKDYEPWYNLDSHSWYKEYATSEEAISFIGLKTLQTPDWKLEEEKTKLSVHGDAKGTLHFLQLETDYQSDDIRLQAFANIYLKGYEEEITYGVRTTEDISYTEDYYTTAHEQQCHILTSTALESGYLCKEGYIVKDGVLYSLNIAYQEKDTRQAEKLMYQWADSF